MTLLDLIYKAIENGALGPDEIVDIIIPEVRLNDDLCDEALKAGIRYLARQALRRIRQAEGRTSHTTGSQRYEAVRAISGNPKHWQVDVGNNNWKRLGDCNIKELDEIAGQYRVRVAQNQQWANRYAQLMGKLDSHGLNIVDELDDEVVQRVMLS